MPAKLQNDTNDNLTGQSYKFMLSVELDKLKHYHFDLKQHRRNRCLFTFYE